MNGRGRFASVVTKLARQFATPAHQKMGRTQSGLRLNLPSAAPRRPAFPPQGLVMLV